MQRRTFTFIDVTSTNPISAGILAMALLTAGLFAGCSKHPAPNAKFKVNRHYPKADAAQVIDLSGFYTSQLGGGSAGISRRQIFDGLPFHVDGKIMVYGQSAVKWENRGRSKSDADSRYPDQMGIPVGREFDELHLLHVTSWQDVDGQTIALIRLNYEDKTKSELPIIYGAHVRDNQRIRTEESESLSDPDSKIIWRGPGIANFKSTQRVFASTLFNPHPFKKVVTMDVVSTRHLAAYELLAATVAKTDHNRPVSNPVPANEPERHFDGRLTIQVVDESGRPIENAVVQPFMDVDGPYMVAAPFYTDETGQGVIRYPKSRTAHISLSVEMKGYASGHAGWAGDFPETNTVQIAHSQTP